MSAIKNVYKNSDSALTFLSDYNPDDVGVVFLPHYSSSVWTIPPPEEDDLKMELTNCKFDFWSFPLTESPNTPADFNVRVLGTSLKVTMEWTLNRNSENPESPKTVSETQSVGMTKEMCDETKAVLESKNNTQMYIPHLMPKFLKITSLGKASPVSKLMRLDKSTFIVINGTLYQFRAVVTVIEEGPLCVWKVDNW